MDQSSHQTIIKLLSPPNGRKPSRPTSPCPLGMLRELSSQQILEPVFLGSKLPKKLSQTTKIDFRKRKSKRCCKSCALVWTQGFSKFHGLIMIFSIQCHLWIVVVESPIFSHFQTANHSTLPWGAPFRPSVRVEGRQLLRVHVRHLGEDPLPCVNDVLLQHVLTWWKFLPSGAYAYAHACIYLYTYN